MTDRPIIFSAPMVRALLEGRKTQTRRILKPQPPQGLMPECIANPGEAQPVGAGLSRGDRLWVCEAWRADANYDDLSPSEMSGEEAVKYEADGSEQMWGWPAMFVPGRLRSPIHMPRWASRLTLTVTDVRVQRLQEISAEDCAREGVVIPDHVLVRDGFMLTARKHFRDLWNSIHGPDAWEANPWVCAISFEVARRNIDAVTP